MFSKNMYFRLDGFASEPNYKKATNQGEAIDGEKGDDSVEDSMMEEPEDFDGDLAIDDLEIVDDDGDYS